MSLMVRNGRASADKPAFYQSGQWYTYVLDDQALAVRWRQEILNAQQRHSLAEQPSSA